MLYHVIAVSLLLQLPTSFPSSFIEQTLQISHAAFHSHSARMIYKKRQKILIGSPVLCLAVIIFIHIKHNRLFVSITGPSYQYVHSWRWQTIRQLGLALCDTSSGHKSPSWLSISRSNDLYFVPLHRPLLFQSDWHHLAAGLHKPVPSTDPHV